MLKRALALSLLVAGPSSAQQNPPGLDWRQIRTERFKVIFPAEITAEAQRVANTLEHIYGPVSRTQEKPLDVVLANQTARLTLPREPGGHSTTRSFGRKKVTLIGRKV